MSAGGTRELRQAGYKAATRAIKHVRSGKGPYFLELMTYRYRGHSMSDSNAYRARAEERMWSKRDPLIMLRDRLVELGVVEYVTEDEAYEPIVGTYPMIQAQAFFNWIGLEEDRSLGVHNPAYVNALLDNTLEALAPATP